MQEDINRRIGLAEELDIDPRPAKRPERKTLEGRFVNVVPLDAELHSEVLYKGSHGANADQLWRYMSDGPFADFDAFDSALKQKQASQDPAFFTIIDKASASPVGHAAYLRIEPRHRCIEVGSILYTPSLQQTSGGTEAMYLMADYVFEELGYRRYEWKCNAQNTRSRRAALRLGFTYEGTFRQHMIVKSCNRDTAWFSMLDSEWPARKANFLRWLAPSNFDREGKQKLSLFDLNAVEGIPMPRGSECKNDSIPQIRIRKAAIDDLPELLRQRRAMYRDSGYTEESSLDAMSNTSEPYIRERMLTGEFCAWIAESESQEPIGCGAVLVTLQPSHPLDPQCRRAVILNVYTYPQWRRRGAARQVMNRMIQWCREQGFRSVTLHTSPDGRNLYESLGFQPTMEMRLPLR